MIKPSQIREKEFAKSTMGGYKTSDVNSFFDEVADSYEQLYKENSELLKKLRLLVDNIEQYRKREQDGEFASGTSLTDAKAEAEKIISDAKLEAERIIADAKKQSAQANDAQVSVDEIRKLREKEKKALCDIKAEAERFRKSLLSMYTEHLTLIQAMVNAASVAKEEINQKQAQETVPEDIPEENQATVQEKSQETDDAQAVEFEEMNSEEDMDAFFAEAVSDEQSRMREAFGGFRFEMGVESTDEVQLEIEEPQKEETFISDGEFDFAGESEDVHSEIETETPEIIVLHDEPSCESEQKTQPEFSQITQEENYQPSQEEVYYDMEIQDDQDDFDDDDDSIEPSFKISFPEDGEDGDGEEENLDDLFEEFFNSFDKHR